MHSFNYTELMEIHLAGKTIGALHAPYFIAEMSGNHNQSLEKALEIVDAAAWAGADALKIQTYKPETMTLDISEGEFFIDDSKSLWKGRSLFDLYAEAMTPWEWHAAIKKRCEQRGMAFFSTPFDHTAVDFLEELNIPFYKIASFENIDVELVKKVATTKKPIIMSTGMASLEELSLSVKTLRDNGVNDLVLLKCTSAYPAVPEEANLITIPHLKSTFNCIVGVSDHTMGFAVPIVATTLGGRVIEKHFTVKRSQGGVDSAFSLEPEEFKVMKEEVLNCWRSLGHVFYGASPSERKSLNFRRTLYFVKDIDAGGIITEENLRAIRPGFGLKTQHYHSLLGKRVNRSIKKGTPASWDVIG